MNFWILPFLIQGLLMAFDEGYFHRKRGLPKWELIGHPVDTISVLLALSVPAFFAITTVNENIFIALAILSSLCVTKDEFVHKEVCVGLEHWLHALQFVLHPILFLAAWNLWQQGEQNLLQTQIFLIFVFFLYQLSEAYRGLRKNKIH